MTATWDEKDRGIMGKEGEVAGKEREGGSRAGEGFGGGKE